jgi:hypothetical protein
MKYLNFKEEWSKTGKTKVITLLAMRDDAKLGTIQWSGRWRQYVFVPTINFENQWSVGCMQDVIGFINKLTEERSSQKLSTKKGCEKRYNQPNTLICGAFNLLKNKINLCPECSPTKTTTEDELPEEAVKGLISACEDVKEGRYKVISSENQVTEESK